MVVFRRCLRLQPLLHCTILFNSAVYSVIVHSLSHVQVFVTSWTAACQASLSLTISQSLLKLMSIESVMPSNHLILCRPLLLLPSIFPSIRVFSSESALCMRWPKYQGFSFSMCTSSEYSGLISFRTDIVIGHDKAWLEPTRSKMVEESPFLPISKSLLCVVDV